MEEIRKLFGQNVRKYRQARCWSQAELAEKIEISDAFMAHIERGPRGASMETIELLARCFEIPYTALFEETPSAGANYAQVLFSLEHELKDKLNADIAACIKSAKELL
mgnify:CR=1 FL=1